VIDITRLNQSILQAEEAGDSKDLARYLDPEFTIVRASGQKQNLATKTSCSHAFAAAPAITPTVGTAGPWLVADRQ